MSWNDHHPWTVWMPKLAMASFALTVNLTPATGLQQLDHTANLHQPSRAAAPNREWAPRRLARRVWQTGSAAAYASRIAIGCAARGKAARSLARSSPARQNRRGISSTGVHAAA